jgi:hypothetical protein
MFEDIISDDPFDNPGADPTLTYQKFDFGDYVIEILFDQKIVKLSGDIPIFDIADDFYEVNQRLGDHSPFVDIDRENGTAKLQDDWQFKQDYYNRP